MARTAIRYRNPVFDGYFADPFAWYARGSWWAVGTGSHRAREAGRAFSLMRSSNLVEWQPLEPVLNRLPAHFGEDYWAPEVAEHEGRFYLYYSVGRGDQGHHLRVALADQPEGPYLDRGPLTLPEQGFAIDGHPFRDDDGAWYLYYARDFLDGSRPGTSLVVDRLNAMTELAGEPRVVLRPNADWQRFQRSRHIYGGVHDWHTLEGPFARRRNGKVWCLFSGGNWQNDSYGVDFAVADHPLGPYTATPVLRPRTLGTIPGKVLGPGHNSVVAGPDGRDWIVYHAWDAEMTARRMCIDPLEWTEQGPLALGPSYEPREFAMP